MVLLAHNPDQRRALAGQEGEVKLQHCRVARGLMRHLGDGEFGQLPPGIRASTIGQALDAEDFSSLLERRYRLAASVLRKQDLLDLEGIVESTNLTGARGAREDTRPTA